MRLLKKTTCAPEHETPPTTAVVTNYHHFTHPHPLQLIICNQQTLNPSSSSSSSSSSSWSCCSGCNLKASGVIYSCTICDFLLHKKCFEMPKMISHVAHKQHPFTILPKPDYANGGYYRCYACSEMGIGGFAYNCKTCGIDMHLLCSSMPLSITHAAHAHKLDLIYGSPYSSKTFNCAICNNLGLDHWLYRCGSCGFDAHLGSATSIPTKQQLR